MSPGGAAFLRTGEILVVCRCSDNVNVFTANGTFKRSFNCGPSPCGVTVNSSDEIIVTDTGAKLVRFYSPEGKLLRTIESSGTDYGLKWPIYVTTNAMDDVIVSDCHLQKVLVFDENGLFKTYFQLRTQGGNQVRGHSTSSQLWLVSICWTRIRIWIPVLCRFFPLVQIRTVIPWLKCM